MTNTEDPTVPKYAVGTYFEVTPYSAWFTFGRYKGTTIRTCPVDYLRWCLHEIADAPEEFYTIIRTEIHRRQHEGVGTLDFGGGS